MKAPILVALAVAAAVPGLAQAPNEVPYSPPPRSAPLASTVVDWSSLGFRATPVGRICPVFDEPTRSFEKLELHITVLNPGMASHSPHRHAWEEMLLIKEGRCEVSINGVRVPAGPGSLVFLASRDAHNITNGGRSPATYYVINFVTGKIRTIPDKPAAQWEGGDLLGSRMVDCDHAPGTPDPATGHRDLLSGATATLAHLDTHVTTLQPGASTSPRHRDPGDEIFVLKSGRLQVTLNGVSSRIGPGSFFYVAPNDERTMACLGDSPATYQVIRVLSESSPPQA
jgi:quercetin dioxygenase-like cupin family protein